MAIIKTVSFFDFCTSFSQANRTDNFSYHGLRVLFDYLENLSEDIGEPVELDVIGLCCDYEEATIEDIIEHHSLQDQVEGLDPEDDDDEIKSIVLDFLNYRTSVCGEVPGGFVFLSF